MKGVSYGGLEWLYLSEGERQYYKNYIRDIQVFQEQIPLLGYGGQV